MTTLENVKMLIADQLNISVEKVNENSRIVDDLGADSLDTVEMLMTLEEKYSIVIPDEVAVTLKTVGSIVNYIESRNK